MSNFYDFLSTFVFRPLILQPTRVSATSATLIDNIFTFVNNIETESIGGNIATSLCSIFSISKPKKQRAYKNFSFVEFKELKETRQD